MSADVSECLCEYVSVSAYVSACAIVLNVHLYNTHVTRTEVFLGPAPSGCGLCSYHAHIMCCKHPSNRTTEMAA